MINIGDTVRYFKKYKTDRTHVGKLLSFNRDFTANIEDFDCGLVTIVDAYNLDEPYADVEAAFKADKPYSRV